MTTATITSKADALTSYRVSEEQVNRVILREHDAIVASQTTEGVGYTVEYNPQFKVLQCSCPAEGGCWHKRATLAAIAIKRVAAKERAARIAEEKEAEATRPASEVAEQSAIEELVRMGTDRETATRIILAKPYKGSGKGKRLDFDPSFSLLKK